MRAALVAVLAVALALGLAVATPGAAPATAAPATPDVWVSLTPGYTYTHYGERIALTVRWGNRGSAPSAYYDIWIYNMPDSWPVDHTALPPGWEPFGTQARFLRKDTQLLPGEQYQATLYWQVPTDHDSSRRPEAWITADPQPAGAMANDRMMAFVYTCDMKDLYGFGEGNRRRCPDRGTRTYTTPAAADAATAAPRPSRAPSATRAPSSRHLSSAPHPSSAARSSSVPRAPSASATSSPARAPSRTSAPLSTRSPSQAATPSAGAAAAAPTVATTTTTPGGAVVEALDVDRTASNAPPRSSPWWMSGAVVLLLAGALTGSGAATLLMWRRRSR